MKENMELVATIGLLIIQTLYIYVLGNFPELRQDVIVSMKYNNLL